jgi:hypothetical protein
MQRNTVEELFTLPFSSFVLLIQQQVKTHAKLTDVSEVSAYEINIRTWIVIDYIPLFSLVPKRELHFCLVISYWLLLSNPFMLKT